MSKKFTSLFFLVWVSCSLLAQDIYVAPDGDDDENDGSQTSPVATIAKAISMVGAGNTIFVLGDGTQNGYTYTITPPLSLTKSLTLSGTGQAVRITTSQNATDLLVISASAVSIEGLILDAAGDNGTNTTNVIKISAPSSGLNTVNIIQNTITGASGSGITIEGNDATVSDLTISNNFINSNGTGLQVSIPLTGNSKIFENDLSGSQTIGLNNTSGQPVNASLNWWGSEAYASVNQAKAGNVDINPWFRTGANIDTRPDLDGFQSLYTPLGIKKLNTNTNVLEEAAQAVSSGGSIFIYYSDAADLTYNTLAVDKPFTIEGFPNPSFPNTNIPAIQGIVTDGGTLTIKGRINVLGNPADDNFAIRLINGDIDASEGRISIDNESSVDYEGGNYDGSLSVAPTTVGPGEDYKANALGLTISSGPEDLGEVSVTRTTGPNGITNFGPNQEFKSIAVRWSIEVDNQPSQDGRDIRLEWTSDYDNGIDVSDAFVWRKKDESSPWTLVSTNQIGGSTLNPDLRLIDVKGVKEFSSWTISDVNNPLPVELTAFNARLEEPHVQLNWETASEENADFFAIERSESGKEFTQIGTIQAAGDSDVPLQYSYLDEQVANRFGGTIFYRLRTVDFDGTYEYSDITSIFINDEGTPRITAFAREGQESIKLFTHSIEPGDYQLWVTDMSGRKLYEQEVQLGNNREHRLSVGNLPRSVYTIRCVGKQLVLATKFKVE